jgi:hypothetical protein
MNSRLFGLGSLLIAAGAADAQITIDWMTIDGGGGVFTGAGLSVAVTFGQADAGPMLTGGALSVSGGYWCSGGEAAPCYANCDASTAAPVLNVNDFQCFLNMFAAGLPQANCDGSTTPPVLNINDFQCFVNRFAAGCT